MSEEQHDAPIIVIKKHAAHAAHGGSWKVAFADFATAMMAFFMLLWLMGSTSKEEQLEIAGYFKRPQDYQPVYDQVKSAVIKPLTDSPPAVNGSDPIAYAQPREQNPTSTGLDTDAEGNISMPNPMSDQSRNDESDQASLNNLQSDLENEIESADDLANFRKQIFISAVPEGIKLDIVDSDKNAMFNNASAELSDEATKILLKLAPVINKVPNKISITGHTDAAPFTNTNGQTNWELSADRANAARRALESGGLDPKHIAQVVGQGSTVLFDEANPNSPLNRRISIVILNQHAEKYLQKASGNNTNTKPASH